MEFLFLGIWKQYCRSRERIVCTCNWKLKIAEAHLIFFQVSKIDNTFILFNVHYIRDAVNILSDRIMRYLRYSISIRRIVITHSDIKILKKFLLK